MITTSTDMKYDLLALSIGSVGTKALQAYLNCHPEIFVPFSTDTDHAILNDQQGLLATFRHNSKKAKSALVIHYDHPDFLAKTANLIENYCKTDVVTHTIRNPIKTVISNYNRNVMQASLSDRNKKYRPIKISDHPDVKLLMRHTVTRAISLKKLALDENKLLAGSGYGVGCHFYHRFNKVRIIEFEELLPEKVNNTMHDLYEIMGVDSSYTDPIFTQCLNSPPENMLKRTNFYIQAFNQEIKLYPVPDNVQYVHQSEWASSHINDYELVAKACLSNAGEYNDLRSRAICFYTHAKYLERLTPKEKAYLFSSEVSDALAKQALRWWSNSFDEMGQCIEKKKVHALPKRLEQKLLKRIKPNLKKLYEFAPHIEEIWKISAS